MCGMRVGISTVTKRRCFDGAYTTVHGNQSLQEIVFNGLFTLIIDVICTGIYHTLGSKRYFSENRFLLDHWF